MCLLLFFTICYACGSDDVITPEPQLNILEKLNQIEDITVEEITSVDHFERLFKIMIKQPVDHNVPDGAFFHQKIFLGHVDEEQPVVFETEGYSRTDHKTRELSPLLGINQLTVEHRYFGESKPGVNDWQYLDIWQAANDHHRIVELFKPIYSESWISSGVSKGGDAAIFHRRFFPTDVDATVAYVAPILFQQYDERFLDYYETVGNASCRNKIKQYQRSMLTKIDSFPDIFDAYVKSVGDFGSATTFSLSYKDIIYHAIREDYMFEFWSSEIESCETIPDSNASLQAHFDHFRNVFDVFLFFSDYGVEFWTPYAYQALTELGNYAFDVSHLTDLEQPIPPLVTFNVRPTFEPSVMADIDNWIKNSSYNMIFIYGEDDPWTVAEVNINPSNSLIKIVNPATKHGTRISDLSSFDQDNIINSLNEWMAD